MKPGSSRLGSLGQARHYTNRWSEPPVGLNTKKLKVPMSENWINFPDWDWVNDLETLVFTFHKTEKNMKTNPMISIPNNRNVEHVGTFISSMLRKVEEICW